MYACYEGAITQVKDLISVGADTKIKDFKGDERLIHSKNTGDEVVSQGLG